MNKPEEKRNLSAGVVEEVAGGFDAEIEGLGDPVNRLHIEMKELYCPKCGTVLQDGQDLLQSSTSATYCDVCHGTVVPLFRIVYE